MINNTLLLPGFRSTQVTEERIKALLISTNSDWEDLILEAESHKYFTGQIGFLLNLANIDKNYSSGELSSWTEEQHVEKQLLFSQYYQITCEIFNYKGAINDENHLWERALLVEGDYLFWRGYKKQFPGNISRDYSWKRFLREFHDETGTYFYIWIIIKKIIRRLKDGETLDDIVTKHLKTNDWRECFIRYKETIDCCGSKRWFLNVDNTSFLLSKTDRRSEFYELNTYFLFNSELKPKLDGGDFYPFTNTEYYPGCTGEEPCAFLDKFYYPGYDITLDIKYWGNEERPYYLYLFAREDKDIGDLKLEIEPLITNDNFSFEYNSEQKAYIYNFSSDNIDLIDQLLEPIYANSMNKNDIITVKLVAKKIKLLCEELSTLKKD